jgi:hypothetical protein
MLGQEVISCGSTFRRITIPLRLLVYCTSVTVDVLLSQSGENFLLGRIGIKMLEIGERRRNTLVQHAMDVLVGSFSEVLTCMECEHLS